MNHNFEAASDSELQVLSFTSPGEITDMRPRKTAPSSEMQKIINNNQSTGEIQKVENQK